MHVMCVIPLCNLRKHVLRLFESRCIEHGERVYSVEPMPRKDHSWLRSLRYFVSMNPEDGESRPHDRPTNDGTLLCLVESRGFQLALSSNCSQLNAGHAAGVNRRRCGVVDSGVWEATVVDAQIGWLSTTSDQSFIHKKQVRIVGHF